MTVVHCQFADYRRGYLTCRNKQALPTFGLHPGIGICQHACPYYKGPKRSHVLDIRDVELAIAKIAESKRPRFWRTIARALSLVPYPEPVPVAGCGHPQPFQHYIWLFMRWYGVPYPLRLRIRFRGSTGRLQWPIRTQPFDGCGCHVVAKDTWERLRWWWRYTYSWM